MRKLLILLALAVVTAANLGCSGRCRNLFRRGSPCCGTNVAAPSMLGGPIPLGSPYAAPQPMQFMPQNVVTQPQCCCEQAPMCNECPPCQNQCVPCDSGCMPCESGYINGSAGYMGQGDCGCVTAPGEYFGGYTEGSAPLPGVGGTSVTPQGSNTYPGPAAGN